MDTISISSDILYKKLKQHFGYSSFRAEQKEIIQRILSGQDTIVLMPTGGGKSLCYQLPAVLLQGITLVVSPLIALMKDQVEGLRANGISAAYLNSSLSSSEQRGIENSLEKGEIKLLYVSPERIASPYFIDFLKLLPLSLIAIDEAHCVSSWGHHFRPEYQRLDLLKKHFPQTPTVALTATADKAVRSDIGDLLGMQNPKTYLSSFDRPNLSLAVLPGQRKWEQIQRLVRKFKGQTGIIYCNSRKGTEQLREKLLSIGLRAACYHAGLPTDEKSEIQEDFIQGKYEVMCATVAFGMGIDKADVRYVVHHNMPGNLESFYQEIGRAGRDGKESTTILFYSYRDVQMQMEFCQEIQNEQYKNIQLAKLDRMREYAEAQICRRKILLSYFGERTQKDCGNCDVCHNPPVYFDGTIHAQKALSAIARVAQQKEGVGMSTLIDLLKGRISEVIREKNLQQIKTFGAGRETTAFAWQLYLQQMIQQGLLEIDYKDHYYLKLTDYSWKVLKENESVRLVDYEVIKQRQDAQKNKAKRKSVSVEEYGVDQGLFQELRSLRKQVAGEIRKPAFVVFSDVSLKDMASKRPRTEDEFLEVNGVGAHKAELYAERFTERIRGYLNKSSKGNANERSWNLYKQGYSIEAIAEKQQLQLITVYSHFSSLLQSKSLDIHAFLTEKELVAIAQAQQTLGDKKGLQVYYNYLNKEIIHGKIRLGLTYLKLKN